MSKGLKLTKKSFIELSLGYKLIVYFESISKIGVWISLGSGFFQNEKTGTVSKIGLEVLSETITVFSSTGEILLDKKVRTCSNFNDLDSKIGLTVFFDI